MVRLWIASAEGEGEVSVDPTTDTKESAKHDTLVTINPLIRLQEAVVDAMRKGLIEPDDILRCVDGSDDARSFFSRISPCF